jgi:DNA-binding MarR family transcriptional regulator
MSRGSTSSGCRTLGLVQDEVDSLVAAWARERPDLDVRPLEVLSRVTRLVTSGTMTNRVDRLESRGLVVRLPDPRDRRGVQVRLTPRGKDAVDAALVDLLRREEELLAALSPRQQDTLAKLLRTLVLPFDREVGPA